MNNDMGAFVARENGFLQCHKKIILNGTRVGEMLSVVARFIGMKRIHPQVAVQLFRDPCYSSINFLGFRE